MTEPTPPLKHLILLGAGHAHLQLLAIWAAHPLAGVQVTLVSPHPRQLCSGMVPGFVAGHYFLEDCAVALEPLLVNSGIHWLPHNVIGLDANDRTLMLDDDSVLNYDWLSINTGTVQDRQHIEQALPGAREYGLFMRPTEAFATLWPRVTELAQSHTLRVAVLGADTVGIELAMAIRHRLPTATVTLITGGAALAASYPSAVQQRLTKALQQRDITVLTDLAVGIQAGEVSLAQGPPLACDVPVIAMAARAPAWLKDSQLALDANGFIAVDACQRATGHPQVYAAGSVCRRVDQPRQHSGIFTERTGAVLAKNLTAVIAGTPPSPYPPTNKSLHLLTCGGQEAIASWGSFALQGQWVWRLKNWFDRSFIKRYRRG
ncbi:MAG: pyridine nucleotide-disulfide oxidoreductase family protein [Rhodoferax sp.]|jgi:pyridine nucleotide-disulfide oxidoreductase family protein